MARPSTSDLDWYLSKIKRFALLSATEESDLARLALAGDPQARDRLIRCNLRLVVSIAQKYKNHGLGLMDLIEEGNIGLIKGLERFDPELGNRVSTYVSHWIKKAIRNALSTTSQTIRIPTHVIETIANFRQVQAELMSQMGRKPDIDEIAEAMKNSRTSLRLLQRAVRTHESGQPVSLDLIEQRADTISDPAAADPINAIFDDAEREMIGRMLDSISEREATILKMRFGIELERRLSLQEVADIYSISRERVRQIENQAINKLHKAFKHEAPA